MVEDQVIREIKERLKTRVFKAPKGNKILWAVVTDKKEGKIDVIEGLPVDSIFSLNHKQPPKEEDMIFLTSFKVGARPLTIAVNPKCLFQLEEF